jgi:hypothetical protein
MRFANDFVSRQPESLTELRDFILEQLETDTRVVINLAEGDDIHELLASIEDGIIGTKTLNRLGREMK